MFDFSHKYCRLFKTKKVIKLYSDHSKGREVYLYDVGQQPVTYQQIIQKITALGYNPHSGKERIYYVYMWWHIRRLTLPDNQRYIVGLTKQTALRSEKFRCGTKLYEFPVIISLGDRRRLLTTSCFSESDKVSDFSNCYVICSKKINDTTNRTNADDTEE